MIFCGLGKVVMASIPREIRSVHLIGLGAVGGMYASLLHDFDPTILTVIAGGPRRERYLTHGMEVNGRPRRFHLRDPREIGPTADLLIVAVKQHHLAQTVGEMARSVGDDTIILSLLNGITSEEIIGEEHGMEKLLYSFCVGTDATREGTRIRYTKVGTIVFGERVNEVVSERVAAVQRLFDRAHIPYSTPRDMMREMWWKFMMNVGINPVSAILRAPYGAFQGPGEARELFVMAAREALELARTVGVDLAEADIERCLAVFETLSPNGKTSMVQDIEAGRKTEIEIFAGTVVARGRERGLATPVNEVLLKMVRALERLAAG